MRPRKEVHTVVALLSWVLFCLRFATIPAAVKTEGWHFLTVCAAFASGEKQRNTVPQNLYFRGFKGIQRNHIERLGVRQREKIRENYSSSSSRFSISARALSGASALIIQAAVLEVAHSLTALSASYMRVELSIHVSVTSCGCCLAYCAALSVKVILLPPFI